MSATIRQRIIELLLQEELNAIEISQYLSIREKEVYAHLQHIKRSLSSTGKKLLVVPYVCIACDYVFKDRQRFDRPGRCPVCKGGHIRMATYRINT